MSFPLSTFPRRQAIRQEYNPLDKSTVFSIFPKPLDDVKPTILPGVFHIDAGSPEKPARLVVGPSSWFREIDETQPMLEIPVSSVQVAKSIVEDYCSGIYGCDMNQSMPGWFFLPGDISVEKLNSKETVPGTQKYDVAGKMIFPGVKFVDVLDIAVKKQNNFFEKQVFLADALWARTNGSPLAITDDMRLAATQLGRVKDWNVSASRVEMINCIACGNMRNPKFPICSHCNRVIDMNLAKQLGILEVSK